MMFLHIMQIQPSVALSECKQVHHMASSPSVVSHNKGKIAQEHCISFSSFS